MTPPRPTAVFYWSAVALLTLPLAVIVVTSLTDTTLVGFPLGSFSLRWYVAALAERANGRALLLSLGLAAGSSVLAVVAGTWIALAAGMLRRPWRWLLLAALNSFDDFIRLFFMGGYDATLPVLIFGRLRSGLTPEINALATLALLATLGVGSVIAWLARRVPRR